RAPPKAGPGDRGPAFGGVSGRSARGSADGDALRAEVGVRVHVRAVVRRGADLEVQVRTGGVAGGTGQADLLTGAHGLAGRDGQRGQVGVLGVVAVVELDDDLVAVRARPAGGDHGAGADGLQRGAGRDAEVDTGVVAAGPHAAGHLVAGADAAAGHRGGVTGGTGGLVGARGLRGGLPDRGLALAGGGLGERGLLLRRVLGGRGRGGLLRGARRGLAVDGQLQSGVDERRVVTDGLAVVGVELLPAAVDVLGVGDLGQVVPG